MGDTKIASLAFYKFTTTSRNRIIFKILSPAQ